MDGLSMYYLESNEIQPKLLENISTRFNRCTLFFRKLVNIYCTSTQTKLFSSRFYTTIAICFNNKLFLFKKSQKGFNKIHTSNFAPISQNQVKNMLGPNPRG